MSDKPQPDQSDKPSVTLPGTVEKIIWTVLPTNLKKRRLPSKGPIICIARFASTTNSQNEKGEDVSLKPGAQVQVTVEAEPKATTPKKTA